MADGQYRPPKAFDFTDASDAQTAAHTDAPPSLKLRDVADQLAKIADHMEDVLEGRVQVRKEPLQEMIAKANADPLLRMIPDEQTMRICISRAKILCWIFFGNGPDLTEAEDRFYSRLVEVDEFFILTMQRLAYARFDATEEEILASTKHDLKRDDYRILWIISLFGAVASIPPHEIDACMQKTAWIFNDGLPFTSLRLTVLLHAKPEDLDENGHLRRRLN